MVSVPGKMLSDHVNLKHRTLFTSEIKFTVVGMVKRQRLTTKLWCAKFVWLWGVVSARSYDNLEIGSLGYTADNIPYACINFHAKSIFRFRDIAHQLHGNICCILPIKPRKWWKALHKITISAMFSYGMSNSISLKAWKPNSQYLATNKYNIWAFLFQEKGIKVGFMHNFMEIVHIHVYLFV